MNEIVAALIGGFATVFAAIVGKAQSVQGGKLRLTVSSLPLLLSVFAIGAVLGVAIAASGRRIPPIQIGVGNHPGSVIAWMGPTNTIPDGWTLCDGRPMAREDHEALYLAIRTTYGNGTNSFGEITGDFNLPDLRKMFLRGRQENRSVGDVQLDSVIKHRHHVFSQSSQDKKELGGEQKYPVYSYSPGEANSYKIRGVEAESDIGLTSYQTDSESDPRLSGIETRPVNVAVNFIIKD